MEYYPGQTSYTIQNKAISLFTQLPEECSSPQSTENLSFWSPHVHSHGQGRMLAASLNDWSCKLHTIGVLYREHMMPYIIIRMV